MVYKQNALPKGNSNSFAQFSTRLIGPVLIVMLLCFSSLNAQCSEATIYFGQGEVFVPFDVFVGCPGDPVILEQQPIHVVAHYDPTMYRIKDVSAVPDCGQVAASFEVRPSAGELWITLSGTPGTSLQGCRIGSGLAIMIEITGYIHPTAKSDECM